MRALVFAAFTGGLFSVPALADTPIQPGQWEIRSQVTSVDMPGAPPQMLQMMKKPHVMRHCVTPEQAARGPQEMLKDKKSDCRFTRYALSGGKLDSVMQCRSAERGTTTVTSRGSYAPGSYDVTSSIVMTGPRGTMKMSTIGQGRRTGPCGK